MKKCMVVSIIFILLISSSLSDANASKNASDPEVTPYETQPSGCTPRDSVQLTYFPARYDSAGLDSFIRATMVSQHIPGVATWLSKNGQVIWEQYYGYARIVQDSVPIPVTDTTIFQLKSISKTITGTAIMQLWERGEFGLDDDVSDYLPFTVRNTHFPDSVITFRMLMTHTSSIHDYWTVLNPLRVRGDSPVPLGEFLANYLVPGGTYYSGMNYNNSPPGEAYDYSNVAIALLGYLVESFEDSFPIHARDSIFQPLGMDRTSWFYADLDTNDIAMGYTWNGTSYDSAGLWGDPYYPANRLKATTPNLAQHLTAIAQYGRIDTIRILDSMTVDTMTTAQFMVNPGQFMGLTWIHYYTGTRWIWAHDGAGDGVSTLYGFCPAENSGAIVLTNSPQFWSGTYPIWIELMNYAQQYGGVEEVTQPNKHKNNHATILNGPLQLPQDKSCKVFDITGRVVVPQQIKPGIYFIEIEGKITQKVVKVR